MAFGEQRWSRPPPGAFAFKRRDTRRALGARRISRAWCRQTSRWASVPGRESRDFCNSSILSATDIRPQACRCDRSLLRSHFAVRVLPLAERVQLAGDAEVSTCIRFGASGVVNTVASDGFQPCAAVLMKLDNCRLALQRIHLEVACFGEHVCRRVGAKAKRPQRDSISPRGLSRCRPTAKPTVVSSLHHERIRR
jgi:hypothetical protein